MNFNDLTNRLSEKQKEQLINAKTQEDLDELFTPDKLLLTEDQLGKVAGGSCFRPSCPVCGSEYIEHPGLPKSLCRSPMPQVREISLGGI